MNVAIAAVLAVQMIPVAHRGLWKEVGVPQNTVESIRAAYQAGARIVETDFTLTDSGEIICLHDKGALAAMTSLVKEPRLITPEDRKKIDLGEKMKASRPYRIPCLQEVLELVPKDRILQSEIKTYGEEYAVKFDAAVRTVGLSETNIVVSCFSLDVLKDFKQRFPTYKTMWLGCGLENSDFDLAVSLSKAKAADIDMYCPGCESSRRAGFTLVQADVVRAAGFEFRLFGVNKPEDLSFAASLRSGAFTTDYFRAVFEWAEAIGGISL